MRACVLLTALAFAAAASAQVPSLSRLSLIGCEDCEGAMAFAGIQALAIATDGRVIAAEANAPHIRVFRPDGTLVSAFGRSGAGPAEFRLPIGIAAADSAFDVVDMTLRRLTRVGSRGQEIHSRRIVGFPTAAAFSPAGDRLILSAGTPLDSVLHLIRPAGDSFAVALRLAARSFPERQPAHLEFLSIAVARDGSLAVGDGVGAYRIRRFRADGTPLAEIRRDIPRVRRTPDEIREETALRDRRMGRVRAMVRAEAGRSAPFTPPPIPAERNYFNMGALQFDERGRLWVRVERAPTGQTWFDLFAPDGGFLGEVRVPQRLGEFALGSGLLAAVVTDELGIERIGVWRIVPR